jgi:hypothetical protein
MMLAVLPPIFMSEYTVITSTGRVLLFSVKACADLYQRAYGGVVFSSQVLDNPTTYDIMIPSNKEGNKNVYTA